MSAKLIIGDNNQVPTGVNVNIIGRDDLVITSDDEGKTYLGPTAVINPTGEIEGNISPSAIIVSSGDTTTADNKNYPCDATGGAFTLTITTALREYNVMKVDGTANVVTLQPDSGTINGAASIPLNTQWQGKTVVFDGTNWIAF